ncbi:MAG: DUF5131 family protein [Devosia sp.]|nr:DUF5131 family protein [Devosia sp.]
MSDGSAIEWTDATWNPIVGCSVVSPGCTNCYAMRLAGTRLRHHPTRAGLTVDTNAGPVWNGQVRFNDKARLAPLHWTRPRMIFVCAQGDLFAEQVPDEWIDRVFAVMALCPQHIFQVLTKRPARMRAYLTGLTGLATPLVANGAWPLPNVWLGTSVEDQRRADERIPELLATPAAVRWISAEPLLGPVDIRRWISTCYECGASCGLRLSERPTVERCYDCGEEYDETTEPAFSEGCPKCGGELEPICPDCGHYMVYQHPDTPNLDWVVVGGESGPGARPMHPDWARSLRDQCAAPGVPFFFKQWGAWAPGECEDMGDYVSFTPRENDVSPRPVTPDNIRWCNASTAPDGLGFQLVGKKAAGRLLDGVEHNGMPNARPGAQP